MIGCGSEVMKMSVESAYVREDGLVVPEPTMLKVERQTGYGSVPGLDDEELCDTEELERLVFIQEWWPILSLPVSRRESLRWPGVDEYGLLDWGAFGTVDFARLTTFDKAAWKADRLQEQLGHVQIMLGMVRERLTSGAKAVLMDWLRQDRSDADGIEDEDARAYVKWFLRARRLRRELRDLREMRRRRRERQARCLFS